MLARKAPVITAIPAHRAGFTVTGGHTQERGSAVRLEGLALWRLGKPFVGAALHLGADGFERGLDGQVPVPAALEVSRLERRHVHRPRRLPGCEIETAG